MSRSYKKVAGGGITTARSDKEYKTAEHRRYRAIIRDLLAHEECEIIPDYKKKYGNTWSAPKDGKCVWYWSLNEFLRKVTIHESYRTQETYYPWHWTEQEKAARKPLRRWAHVERPATRGDWKREWIGK